MLFLDIAAWSCRFEMYYACLVLKETPFSSLHNDDANVALAETHVYLLNFETSNIAKH